MQTKPSRMRCPAPIATLLHRRLPSLTRHQPYYSHTGPRCNSKHHAALRRRAFALAVPSAWNALPQVWMSLLLQISAPKSTFSMRRILTASFKLHLSPCPHTPKFPSFLYLSFLSIALLPATVLSNSSSICTLLSLFLCTVFNKDGSFSVSHGI